MLNSAIVRTVEFCTRHIWGVIIVALILAGVSGTYTVRHFAIDTNVNNLISRDLPWRKRELEYQAAFPQNTKLILVVVEGPTPEQTAAATRALAEGLSNKPAVFRSVQEEGGGVFFQRNRLLFLPTEQVARTTGQLANAEPIIGVLAKDPSLRGLALTLSYGVEGLKLGRLSPEPWTWRRRHAASRPASFSWDALLQGNAQLCERAGGRAGLLRRRCLDDNEDQLPALRKCRLVLQLPLAPRKVTRDQIVDVGIDRKVTYRVCPRHRSQNDREDNDDPNVTGTELDRANDCRIQHGSSSRVKETNRRHLGSRPDAGSVDHCVPKRLKVLGRSPVKTPIHIISDTPEGATRRDGNGKNCSVR
jgi:hypothetical protein